MNILENLKQRFNIEKLITIYDRGYPSIELMVKTIDLDLKFLIRLPKNVFKRQINKMKTNDKIIKINMIESRLRAFDDENLRVFRIIDFFTKFINKSITNYTYTYKIYNYTK